MKPQNWLKWEKDPISTPSALLFAGHRLAHLEIWTPMHSDHSARPHRSVELPFAAIHVKILSDFYSKRIKNQLGIKYVETQTRRSAAFHLQIRHRILSRPIDLFKRLSQEWQVVCFSVLTATPLEEKSSNSYCQCSWVTFAILIWGNKLRGDDWMTMRPLKDFKRFSSSPIFYLSVITHFFIWKQDEHKILSSPKNLWVFVAFLLPHSCK